ncbi:ATP-binding cassette subfamily B protein [Mycoplasmopsis mustelae]|uniref:ATP-binding cassette subfamily B protein n=1 Tax=Mycoplasmopsis mustelae TaxID=171289 RepID=A0A4R7UE17_9BACT|nr:ABC transporter ATP-binding protein [Mycoplasmopsis mustelae]TDV23048.1 ATP-binding cassette subfamily B protein [Mycoplasmopsis mustelae]
MKTNINFKYDVIENKVISKNKKITLFSISYGTRWLFLTTIILNIVSIILETYMPLFVKNILDTINKTSLSYDIKYQAIVKYSIYLIVFGVLTGIFTLLAAYLNVVARYRYAKNLRYVLFAKVQTFSFEDLDKFSTGVIVNRLSSDVDNIVKLYGIIGRPLFRLPIMFVASIVFAAQQSGTLSIIFAITLPLLLIFFVIMWKYGIPIFSKTFKKTDEYNSKLQENLNSMRVIKSYVTEEQEQVKHDQINLEMRDISIKGEKIFTWYHIVIMNTIFMSVITLVLIGIPMVLKQEIEIGTITAFSTYIWMITGSFMGILNISGELFRSIPSAKRYKEIIDHQISIIQKPNAIAKEITGNIEFKNVVLKYKSNDFNSLENINLSIQAGKSLGIIGSTSSGKSSLLNLIPRFYDVSDGQIFIDDIDVRNYQFSNLRAAISAVFQNTALFSGSIRDNMKWGNPQASDDEIIIVLKQACIWDFVANQPNQLDYHIEQGGENLSGGQKQRFCIARALLKKPKILLLDDATSALDTKTEKSIQDALNSLSNVTTLIVSQKINFVRHCDNIIILDNGKIIASGTHQQLLHNSKYYAELYQIQSSLGGLDEN